MPQTIQRPKPRKGNDPSVPVRLTCDDPSRTKQSFTEECNINNIMSRFEKTKVVEHLNQHQGNYGDFTHSTDYHASLLAVMHAQDSFNSLPSQLRAKFNNDPGTFLDFVDNPENIDELREMGLLPRDNASEQVAAAPGGEPVSADEPVQGKVEPKPTLEEK